MPWWQVYVVETSHPFMDHDEDDPDGKTRSIWSFLVYSKDAAMTVIETASSISSIRTRGKLLVPTANAGG